MRIPVVYAVCVRNDGFSFANRDQSEHAIVCQVDKSGRHRKSGAVDHFKIVMKQYSD